MRVYNFSAGPAQLPLPVLEQAASELTDWRGSGMSVLEVSHRGKDFVECAADAEAALRSVASIPDNYKILFLAGGATGQSPPSPPTSPPAVRGSPSSIPASGRPKPSRRLGVRASPST